ncbi:restriction endonuclease subunit S [Ligilactobacillus acidipiscis]|uniref:Type I restriction-modification system, specificity subunit S n=1 Tax=Ligilactobacillus acidipiscis TaxID=89059 RepID=A0A1K1KL72_9LACO|nr:restriction endonuclease subunit S [Ligilactobacillus acidipiscis]SFV39636.1 Type I restriction-modification system, specificity subunit S [Ligilactobacillus acidipiscis]
MEKVIFININDNLSTLIDEIYRNMIKISELKETNIDKIGSVVGGGTPSTKKQTYWGGKIPWLTPKDLSQNPTLFTSYGNKFITRSGLDNSSAKILPPKTILFSSRAPIGYISISKNKLATNQGFKSIIPNKGYPYSFIYELIKNETNKLINESNGSTFKEISSKQLKQHVISIPCKEEINLFDNQVNKLFETIQVLESETTTLNNLKKQLLSQFLN